MYSQCFGSFIQLNGYCYYGLLKQPHKSIFICTEERSGTSACAHIDVYDLFALYHFHAFEQPVLLTVFGTLVSLFGFILTLHPRVQVKLVGLCLDLELVVEALIKNLIPKTHIQKENRRIISQWRSGDSLKKEQILNDLDILCLDNGWCTEELVSELSRLNGQWSANLIAAENGRLILLLPVIYYKHSLFEALMRNSSPDLGTFLHSALRSDNLPLIMLMVEQLTAGELTKVLSLDCATPAMNFVIESGVKALNAKRDAELFDVVVALSNNRSRPSGNRIGRNEYIYEVKGGWTGTVFSHHNHTVEVAKLLRMDQDAPAFLVAAAVQSVVDRLFADKLFC